MSACHGVEEEYYLYDSQIHFSCCLLTITGHSCGRSRWVLLIVMLVERTVPPFEACFRSIIII